MRWEQRTSAAGADVRYAGERPTLKDETKISIQRDQDLVAARQKGRALAQQLGFSNSNLTLIATAISELARNILLYAKTGEMTLGVLHDNGRRASALWPGTRAPASPTSRPPRPR